MLNLDKLALVNLDIHIWSGRHKLRPEDLDLAQSQIPPHELATLGSKRSISRKALNPLEADKRAAERVLQTLGVRFLSAYAVSLEKLPVLTERLDRIQAEFNGHRAKLLDRYETEVEAHVQANPRYERAIRAVVVPASNVAQRTSFSYQTFRIATIEEMPHAGLEQALAALPSQLFTEIADDARAFYERSLHGKDTLQARSLVHVMRLGEKLASLAFLDHRIAPVVREITTVLRCIPTDATTLTGAILVSIRGLVALLSDPDRMLAHGAGVIQTRVASAPNGEGAHRDERESVRSLSGPTPPTPAGLFY